MIRSTSLVGILLIFIASLSISAQEGTRETRAGASGMSSELRRHALVMDINARVLSDQIVAWDESDKRIAVPGSPVGIQLVGSNIILIMQFTPFVRRQGNSLVAQGQIWIHNPDGSLGYFTYIQTVPMEFNEPIYFFPLGADTNPSIQIIIKVNPNNESAP